MSIQILKVMGLLAIAVIFAGACATTESAAVAEELDSTAYSPSYWWGSTSTGRQIQIWIENENGQVKAFIETRKLGKISATGTLGTFGGQTTLSLQSLLPLTRINAIITGNRIEGTYICDTGVPESLAAVRANNVK